MGFEREAIRAAVERAFNDVEVQTRRDIAFHMTDWLSDLLALTECFQAPVEVPPEKLRTVLEAFLIHVPNHVAAAGKLAVDSTVSDIFDVGAVKTIDK